MTLLSGKVETSDGLPMAWVAVILDPNTDNQTITLTNNRGEFAFQSQPGKHRLAVRTFAYQPYTEDINLTRSGDHKEISLHPTLRKLNYV